MSTEVECDGYDVDEDDDVTTIRRQKHLTRQEDMAGLFHLPSLYIFPLTGMQR